MVLTLALTAMLAASPAPAVHSIHPSAQVPSAAAAPAHRTLLSPDNSPLIAIDLHPMTEEERQLYPGRERFDKTEWYESLFKSAKIVTMPEHVDEWHNGGVDAA